MPEQIEALVWLQLLPENETQKKLLQMLNAETVAPWRPSQKTKLKKPKFLVGDSVRISNINTPVQEGLQTEI